MSDKINLDANENNIEAMPTEESEKEFYWDDLTKSKDSVTQSLIKQQLLLLEFYKLHKDKIDKDQNLVDAINGLSLSYEDVAKEIKRTYSKHAGKTGHIKSQIDKLEYIEMLSSYTVAGENIGNLASIGFLDLFSSIGTYEKEVKELKRIYENAREENKNNMTKLSKIKQKGNNNG